MKRVMTVLLMGAMSAWETQPAVLSLPLVVHVDTEVRTNVVISSWQRGSAKVTFSLSCIATPSNNVEAAFFSNVKLKMENVKCGIVHFTFCFFRFIFGDVWGQSLRGIIERELRRVFCSSTMGWHRQLIRPAHEVAVGMWMSRLDFAVERPQLRQKAPVAAPNPKAAPSSTPTQAKCLATLDALLVECLVTKAEYDAKRIEILEDR